MATSGGGLSLYDAARSMGVIFTEEAEPQDRTVVANGLELHYLDWGNEGNPVLVLLHGLRGHAHSWDDVSAALSPNHHVLALDQRGRGDTDWAEDGADRLAISSIKRTF